VTPALIASLAVTLLATAEVPVTARDGVFIDNQGRHVILHGVNAGNKQAPYLAPYTAEDFAQMREWGFNCVRLMTFWAGIEPECGKYDEAYLDAYERQVNLAGEQGLFVLVDMHQDLFGEGIPGGDGAPKWACLTNGRTHIHTGDVWSDAYWTSPAVHACFDNFWANKPGPDGVGVQDRFAMAWGKLAERFADNPHVVGYDILNEPFIGSGINFVLLAAGAELYKMHGEGLFGQDAPAVGEIITDDTKRWALIQKLEVPLLTRLLGAIAPLFQEFEVDNLGPMYQRVANVIRQHDRARILFIEPSVSTNWGVVSALPAVQGPDGKQDPLQALASHAYDLVTDTKNANAANEGRLAMIFKHHRGQADRMGMPLFVGEWGAFYGSDSILPVAWMLERQLETACASDTYWSYHEGFDKTVFFKTLSRPYPMAVAGKIESYHFEPASRAFTCTFSGPPSETASQFYIPKSWYPKGVQVTVEPPAESHLEGQLLTLPGAGQAGPRTLTVLPAAGQ